CCGRARACGRRRPRDRRGDPLAGGGTDRAGQSRRGEAAARGEPPARPRPRGAARDRRLARDVRRPGRDARRRGAGGEAVRGGRRRGQRHRGPAAAGPPDPVRTLAGTDARAPRYEGVLAPVRRRPRLERRGSFRGRGWNGPARVGWKKPDRGGQGMVKMSKASEASGFAAQLAKDKKFRKELLSAIKHGTIAQRRAKRKMGFLAVARGMSRDPKLRREVQKMVDSVDRLVSRMERKRGHKVRNTLLVLGGVGGAAAIVVKMRMNETMAIGGTSARTLEASEDGNVPGSIACHQWKELEDFPLFMEGVEHVQQLDDTRLRWVANVAGRKAEWEAKILEQHPDRQISWISQDGKKTRGTVSFEPRAEGKTLVRL